MAPKQRGGGDGGGVGGVSPKNADFAEGAPTPCAEPPVYAVRVARSSMKKLCTDPPYPRHAARVGGP